MGKNKQVALWKVRHQRLSQKPPLSHYRKHKMRDLTMSKASPFSSGSPVPWLLCSLRVSTVKTNYCFTGSNSVHVSGLYKKASRLTLCYLNVVLPRSITTSGFFSFATVWFTRHEDCVKAWISQGVEAVQEAVWGLFVGSVRGSSVMPLSLVQGDHRGDAGTEEESLPCSRNSKKSSGSLCLVLSVWREYAYIITLWFDWQNESRS